MKKLRYSILNPLVFVIILWQIKSYEYANSISFVRWGIFPRETFGLKGIFFWGFIHGDFEHLASNTFPLLIMGSMIYYFYDKLANSVIVLSYFFTGLMVWIFGNPDGSNGFHIGASGLVYAIFGFLFFSGWLRKDKASIAISLVVTVFYGGIFWGILPVQSGVSWEGHLFGMLSGLILSFYFKNQFVVKKKEMKPTPDFRHPKVNVIYTPSSLAQCTSSLVMIRPHSFGFNEETSETNAFQQSHELLFDRNLNKLAVEEFDGLVRKMQGAGINAMVFEDQVHKVLPDAVFPNNWISMHHDGTVIQYPMLAKNRREERREDIIDLLVHKHNFNKSSVLDLSVNEKEELFLEGTGSMIFDHVYKIAYANISSRTNQEMFFNLCNHLGYQPAIFHAEDKSGNEIYHTNVLMSVGEQFAVVCMDVVRDDSEQNYLRTILKKTKNAVIEISEDQMYEFCGNILQVEDRLGGKHIIMSTRAHNAFTPNQIDILSTQGNIIHSDLSTIENFGGGGARCMLAEVFLPR